MEAPGTVPVDLRTQIETPENVRLDVRLAGPATRLGAYLLDLLIRVVVFFALSIFLGLLSVPVAHLASISSGLLLVSLFIIEWGYACLFESLWNGQTPGKRVLGLRVIKTEGYAIGFYEAMLRNLLRAADALPAFYGVGLVSALTSPRMQRVGDLVAGTIVVREKRQSLRERLPALDTVAPISLGELRHSYRPTERTLDVIDALFRREDRFSRERVNEIARVLAVPLARGLGYVDERHEVVQQPRRFLLRVLRTFQEPEDAVGLERKDADGAWARPSRSANSRASVA